MKGGISTQKQKYYNNRLLINQQSKEGWGGIIIHALTWRRANYSSWICRSTGCDCTRINRTGVEYWFCTNTSTCNFCPQTSCCSSSKLKASCCNTWKTLLFIDFLRNKNPISYDLEFTILSFHNYSPTNWIHPSRMFFIYMHYMCSLQYSQELCT